MKCPGLWTGLVRRDWRAAVPCFREALALAEAHPGPLIRSEIHRHLGFYHLVEEVDLDRALRHLRISLDLREEYGDPRWIPSGTLALGQAELAAGERESGVRRIEEAARQSRDAGLHPQRIEMAESWARRAREGEIPRFRR